MRTGSLKIKNICIYTFKLMKNTRIINANNMNVTG